MPIDSTTHMSILSLGIRLGYFIDDEKGCCQGIGLRWLEASLSNETPKLNQLIERILNDTSLVRKLNKVEEKVKQREPLSPKDLELFEILGFYESVRLYQGVRDYPGLFDESISQYSTDITSTFASSTTVEAQGGLTSIYSDTGIYTQEEISTYLNSIAHVIEQAGYPENSKIGIKLNSHEHSITLTYQVGSKTWECMDINQWPSKIFEADAMPQLVNQIFEGFTSHKQNPLHSFIAFNTNVITTGNDSLRTQLATDLHLLKESHPITPEIAVRQEEATMAHLAASAGNVDILKALHKLGANLDIPTIDGLTPIYLAAQNGHADAVRELINSGVDPTICNQILGTPPILAAAQHQRADVIAVFAELHADLNTPDRDGATAMLNAASIGDLKLVQLLAELGADVNRPKTNGTTPLHIATKNGHAQIVSELISHGADVNSALSNGATSLFIAAVDDNLEMIKLLADHSADVNQPRTDRVTPLHVAALNGHTRVVSELITRGADVNSLMADGFSPLFLAIQNGHLDAVKVFADHGFDINKPQVGDVTPLVFAALTGQDDIVSELIVRGADPNKALTNGLTPIFLAVLNGKTDVVKVLLQNNVKLAPYPLPIDALRGLFLEKMGPFRRDTVEEFIRDNLGGHSHSQEISITLIELATLLEQKAIVSKLNEHMLQQQADNKTPTFKREDQLTNEATTINELRDTQVSIKKSLEDVKGQTDVPENELPKPKAT